jgi:hypothetical protein
MKACQSAATYSLELSVCLCRLMANIDNLGHWENVWLIECKLMDSPFDKVNEVRPIQTLVRRRMISINHPFQNKGIRSYLHNTS